MYKRDKKKEKGEFTRPRIGPLLRSFPNAKPQLCSHSTELPNPRTQTRSLWIVVTTTNPYKTQIWEPQIGTWKFKARCRHTEVEVWSLDIWNRSVHRVSSIVFGMWIWGHGRRPGRESSTTMLNSSCLAAINENTIAGKILRFVVH